MFDEHIRAQLFATEQRTWFDELNLYRCTWHPALPGVAFCGLVTIVGSVFLYLDLQSRWIARSFSHSEFALTEDEIRSGVEDLIVARKQSGYVPVPWMGVAAHLFAEKLSCEIDYSKYPQLAECLLVGPMVPQMFRIFGYGGGAENGVEMYRKGMGLTGVVVEDVQASEEYLVVLRKSLEAFKSQKRTPPGLEKAIEYVEELHVCRKAN